MALLTRQPRCEGLVRNVRRINIAGVRCVCSALLAIALGWTALGVVRSVELSTPDAHQTVAIAASPASSSSSLVPPPSVRAQAFERAARQTMPWPHLLITAAVFPFDLYPRRLSRAMQLGLVHPTMPTRRLHGYDAAAPPTSSLL